MNPKRQKYEYLSGTVESDEHLNELGQAGWEMVSVVNVSTHIGFGMDGGHLFEQIPHAYFKRPLGMSEDSTRLLAIANRVGA